MKKMKRLRGKKGFTMVELLATIVVLGIVTAISIASIQGVLKRARDNYYSSQEDNMTEAASNYLSKNKLYEPKVSGEIIKISLRELRKEKYISGVVDYKKKECDEDASYVQVFNYENDLYYTSYLSCPTYTTNLKAKATNYDPFEVKITGDIEDLKGSFKIKETKDGLVTYYYKIYRNGKSVYESPRYDVKKTNDEIKKSFSLMDYIPGKIKLSVTAINAAGISLTESAESDIINDSEAKLKCGENPTGASTTWTTSSRTIKIKCIDAGGIGCAKEEFTKKFTTDMDIGYIKIYDKEGNFKNCPVDVYIDTTPPTVPTTHLYKWANNSTTPTTATGLSGYTAGEWSDKKIFTKPDGSTDAGSGEIYYQYKLSGAMGTANNQTASYFNITTEGESKIAYRACDKLGNCSNYNTEKTIKIDWSAPTRPTISGGSDAWRTGNRIVWTSTQSTARSGIKKYQYCSQTSNTSSGCTWVDLTNNTNGATSVSGLDVAFYHANYGDLINAFGGDVGMLVNHYNNNGRNEGRQKSSSTWIRNAQNISTEGTRYIFFKAISNSGLESQISNGQTLKIDKGNPTVTALSVTSRDSRYRSRYIRVSVNASDSVSGLNAICYTTSNNYNTCNWTSATGASNSASWDVTSGYSDGSGSTQNIYAFARDNAGRISAVRSQGYTLYRFCTETRGYQCGIGATHTRYYSEISNPSVCNQPGVNNGWGLKLVNCPYFDKYFTSHQCSTYERRACPCDTWNSQPETAQSSLNVRRSECNSLYCNYDICKPSYCFDTGNRSNPNCRD